MADKSGSPNPIDTNSVRRRQLPSVNGPLIDTPKSVTRRFTTPGSSPLNIRKSTRTSKAKYGGTTEALESTDDEYFAQPLEPRQIKKNIKNKKKSDSALERTSKELARSNSQVATTSRLSDSQLSVKSFETENFNMILKLLNEQTERLENQMLESKNSILSTMEEKMESILEEIERRMST